MTDPDDLARRLLERGGLSAKDVLGGSSEVLDGRYELAERVGMGAAGEVFKARDRKLGRVVAVKRLRARAESPEEAARREERFRRELDALARLKHEGIPVVHDAGVSDGQPYVVMEFVEGVSLDRHIEERRPSREERVRLVADVARIVHVAHEAGFVHRDLKPSNVLVDPRGRPHVLDFGIAKDTASEAKLTRPGVLVGTYLYMSPEQANGEAVDRRSDVFSLGTILYEVLTGKLPFEAHGAGEALDAILNRGPVPPTRRDPAIGARLEGAIMRALAKAPHERPATALAFAAEVEAALQGGPKLRHAVIAAAACSAGGVVLAVALGSGAPPPRPRPPIPAPPVAPPPVAAPKGIDVASAHARIDEWEDARPLAGETLDREPLVALRTALESADREDPGRLLALARIARLLGDRRRAREHLDAAIELRPEPRFLTERALVRWEELLPERVRGTRLGSLLEPLRADLALAAAQPGDGLAAWLRDWAALPGVESVPGLADRVPALGARRVPLAKKLLGDLLLLAGRPDAARGVFRELASAGRNPEVLVALALAEARAAPRDLDPEASYESARSLALRAHGLLPGFPDAAFVFYAVNEATRDMLEARIGGGPEHARHLEAIHDVLSQMLGANAGDPLVRAMVCRAALDLQVEGSPRRVSLELCRGNEVPEAVLAFGGAHVATDPELAAKCLRSYLEVDPRSPVAHLLLGDALAASGRDGTDHWRRAASGRYVRHAERRLRGEKR